MTSKFIAPALMAHLFTAGILGAESSVAATINASEPHGIQTTICSKLLTSQVGDLAELRKAIQRLREEKDGKNDVVVAALEEEYSNLLATIAGDSAHHQRAIEAALSNSNNDDLAKHQALAAQQRLAEFQHIFEPKLTMSFPLAKGTSAQASIFDFTNVPHSFILQTPETMNVFNSSTSRWDLLSRDHKWASDESLSIFQDLTLPEIKPQVRGAFGANRLTMHERKTDTLVGKPFLFFGQKSKKFRYQIIQPRDPNSPHLMIKTVSNIQLWNWRTGKMVAKIASDDRPGLGGHDIPNYKVSHSTDKPLKLESFAFSPTGHRLFLVLSRIYSSIKTFRALDTATGDTISEFSLPSFSTSGLTDLSISHDGTQVVIDHATLEPGPNGDLVPVKSIKILNFPDNGEKPSATSFPDHFGRRSNPYFVHGTNWVATGYTKLNQVHLRSAYWPDNPPIVIPVAEGLHGLTVDPFRPRIAVVTNDGNVRIYDMGDVPR